MRWDEPLPALELRKADYGIFDTFYRSMAQGALSVGKGLLGTAEFGLELLPWVEDIESMEKMRFKIESAEKKFETDPDSPWEWGASVLGQALPYMGSALAAGYVGGPIAAGGIGFAVEGQEAYDNAIKRGQSEGKANTERAIVGTVNAIIEGLQISKLMKFSGKGTKSLKFLKENIRKKAWDKVWEAGGEFGKDILINSVEEGLQEALQEGVQIAVPYALEGKEALPLKPDGTVDIMSLAKRVGTSALAGAVVSPFLGGARAFAQVVADPKVGAMIAERDRLVNEAKTDVDKAVVLREFNRIIENTTGLSIEEVEGIAREKEGLEPELQEKPEYKTRLDKLEAAAEQVEEFRPYSEKEISKKTGEAFSEMKNMLEELRKTRPDLSPMARAAKAMYQLKGKRSPGFSLTDLSLTEEDFNSFYEAVEDNIKSDFDKAMAFSALHKLFTGESIPEYSEMKALEPVVGKTIVRKLTQSVEKLKRKKLKFGQKVWRNFVDAMNLPRALLASMDVSASGRQGFFILFTDPKAWYQGLTAGYKAFLSPEYADYIDLLIRTRPGYQSMKNNGIFLSEIGDLNKSEEYFASSFARRIPGIKASERAYVTTLNVMRANTYAHIAEQWVGAGKSKADYQHLAKMINHLTGRGDLKWLKDHANTLNIAFFAPKLLAARIQTPADLIPTGQTLRELSDNFDKWKKGEIKLRQVTGPRRILAGTLVKAFGTGCMLMFLLSHLKGVSVEKDPRSSDFGKVKIGDTRFDIWSGYSQIMRLVAGLAFGQRKTVGTGEIIPVKRMEIGARFLQTKLSPMVGAVVDSYRGENFKGDIIHPTLESGLHEFYERFVPLFIQDTADACRYQGYNGLSLVASVSAVHGIGVMTYPESEGVRTAKVKDQYAREFFNQKWSDLGPQSQQLLRLTYPVINEQELIANRERLDRKANTRMMNEIKSSERQLLRSFKPEVKDELDRLLVDVGGLSRKIGTDWYLNDKRYLQYKKTVSDRLNEILPMYLNLDLEPVIKRQLIDKVIFDIKKSVRAELINSANIKDFSSDFPGKR